MNDNHEAIIAGEIPALEQEILNSPSRREEMLKSVNAFGRRRVERKEGQYLTALKFCLEYCREGLYLTKVFRDFFFYLEKHIAVEANFFIKTKGDMTDEHHKHWLQIQWGTSRAVEVAREDFGKLIDDPIGPHFAEVCNIVFYRRTVMLQGLFQQFKLILAEEPAIVQNGNNTLKQIISRMGDQCLEERRHKRPLNLLVAKNVQIEGDVYGDAVTFLRQLGLEKEVSSTRQNTDKIVDQAFQRIAEAVSNQKEAERRVGDLLEKCRALKVAFPEASAQIDKLFRQEVENLKR